MGAVQSDHSKSYTLYIKVPNPIVTFPNFPSNANNFEELQRNFCSIVQSSISDLQSENGTILQTMFDFVGYSQTVIREKILKQCTPSDLTDTEHQLTEFASHTTKLNQSFHILLQDGISDDDRTRAIDDGLSACQEILRYFFDESRIFQRNFFISSPCVAVCAVIIHKFSKMWLTDGQRKGLTELQATVQYFKEKCIEERLGNIKMLRTQSVSYNVHDYSYEAQVRKDVSFGGKINDFYDKRPINEIAFRDHPLTQASDADRIVDGYRNEVQREYEQFFDAIF